MRKVIGYVDGKAIWSPNVPADPGYRVIRGSFVVGAHGTYEQQRITSAAHRAKERAAKEAKA